MMPQTDLEPDFTTQEAARWLVETPRDRRGGPAIPELRKRFGINSHQAIEAIRLANIIRSGGGDAAAA